jgi:uncharacterized membrane protein YfcA
VDDPLIAVLIITFAATLVRSAFGFGEDLIALPLLALLMPIKAAVPLVVLLSTTVATVILLQDWRKVQVRSAAGLLLSTLFGIPLGLLGLTKLPEAAVKVVLAVVILVFAVYCLFSRKRMELKDDRLSGLFGFGAGVLGGAYGMNGPPLVVYGALRHWPPEHFRATLQGYFLPASGVALVGYWLTGLWVPTVTHYYLLSLPLAAVAIVLGRIINRHMDRHSFLR